MSLLSQLRRGLNASQMENARVIEQRFRGAGLPAGLAAAAIVNAIHESNLNAAAHNTSGEDSAGLFQLNARGGLGTGMSLAERMDPVASSDKVIQEIKRLRLDQAAQDNPSVAYLSRLFANKIERCAACGYQGGSHELDRRAATAEALFPEYVSYGLPWWAIPVGIVGLGGGAAFTYWWFRLRG
jgi:hypothetical protein